MSKGNGMGPNEMGTGTGRKMGYCTGHDRPGCSSGFQIGRNRAGHRLHLSGKGYARASAGMGRGMGCYRYGFSESEGINEKDFLKKRQEVLGLELEAVKERIKTIDEKESDK